MVRLTVYHIELAGYVANGIFSFAIRFGYESRILNSYCYPREWSSEAVNNSTRDARDLCGRDAVR